MSALPSEVSATSARVEVDNLLYEQQYALGQLVVMTQFLTKEDIRAFLEQCGVSITPEETMELVQAGLVGNTLAAAISNGNAPPTYCLVKPVRDYLGRSLSDAQRKRLHTNAEQFYRRQFVAFLETTHSIEEVSHSRNGGEYYEILDLVHALAHRPQMKEAYHWAVSQAYYWQEQLFALGEKEKAAGIVNAICFALAQNSQRDLALDLLARDAQALHGVPKGTSLANLATLLREDQEHKAALQLYKRSFFPLARHGAFHQLAGVCSEVSNIHRDQGHLVRAIFFQWHSSLLRSVLGDTRGKAICNNQLSILYRSAKLYPFALRNSRAAESYFRATGDQVNLANTLLTQGNILNLRKKTDAALQCFEECLVISQRLRLVRLEAGALSGIGRAKLDLNEFSDAQTFLERAIALRQQQRDHLVGIEYENMARLYETQGDFGPALEWYHKALPYFQRYLPKYTRSCLQSIEKVERQRRRTHKR